MRRYLLYLAGVISGFLMASLFFSSCAAAQEKTNEKADDQNVIKESDFKEILSKAAESLKGKTYRLTKTEESFSDRSASAEKMTTNILEIVLPDKRREVKEVKSAAENSRVETIWDGKNLYEKKDNDPWKKYLGGGGNGGGGNITSGRVTTIYKFVGKESLNEKIVNVYETEMRRIANKFTQTSRYRVEYVTKTKYWISEDGYFLKTLKESEVIGSNSLERETEVYEYDSNITIEAPIK